MSKKKMIVCLQEGHGPEVWTALTKACAAKGLDYNKVKAMDFPFSTGKYYFFKIQVNQNS